MWVSKLFTALSMKSGFIKPEKKKELLIESHVSIPVEKLVSTVGRTTKQLLTSATFTGPAPGLVCLVTLTPVS